MIVRRRRLPHVEAGSMPQFITFRLQGSLPANRIFPPSNVTPGEAFVAMDRLLDRANCGPVWLRQPSVARLVRTSILYGVQIEHYELHAWVIMPNHVHMLLTPLVPLSKLLGSLKAATAKYANQLLQRTGQPF
jgi:hypothetical protein